jgi:FKBP-type peptidyl-prolyl cis-trans isomerase
MKQTLFAFLLISVLGMASCRKDNLQLTIKQYDQQQMESYIAAHGLTGMRRDTIGGDTTGMYYQILNPGTQSINGVPVTPLDYPDEIAFVYTERTFDGTYVLPDTVANHYFDFVGHIYADHYPLGLQTAIHNLLKYPDASIRVLIPSHLAYGRNGSGSGSSQVANNRIAGNACLDFYVHAVNNFQVYDDMVIQNYLKANNLTGYTPVKMPVPLPLNPLVYWVGKNANPPQTDFSATYYYKILTPPTASDSITVNSTATVTYSLSLFNGALADNYNVAGGEPLAVSTLVPGVAQGLQKFAMAGTKISLILPSTLGYGVPAQSVTPAFSCLRFTFVVISVTP